MKYLLTDVVVWETACFVKHCMPQSAKHTVSFQNHWSQSIFNIRHLIFSIINVGKIKENIMEIFIMEIFLALPLLHVL
jgi:hypothetical protein